MRVAGSAAEWELSQWSNDWITATTGAGEKQHVLSPLRVILNADEIARFRADEAKPVPRSSGTFWAEWRLRDDGRFVRNPRPAPHRERRV